MRDEIFHDTDQRRLIVNQDIRDYLKSCHLQISVSVDQLDTATLIYATITLRDPDGRAILTATSEQYR